MFCVNLPTGNFVTSWWLAILHADISNGSPVSHSHTKEQDGVASLEIKQKFKKNEYNF